MEYLRQITKNTSFFIETNQNDALGIITLRDKQKTQGKNKLLFLSWQKCQTELINQYYK